MSNFANSQKPGGWIPNRESIAEQQVNTALSMLHALMPYVLAPHRDPMNLPKELDGGTECAAVTTFVKICSRLDAMLDDPTRWKLEDHDKLYAAILESHRVQQIFVNEQIEAAKVVQRPSYQLKPTLAVAPDNSYVAFWGDIKTPGAALIGRGNTPAEALADFDQSFHRMPNEQTVVIADSVKPAEEPKQKKKK